MQFSVMIFIVKFLLTNGSDVDARADRKIMPLRCSWEWISRNYGSVASERCGHKCYMDDYWCLKPLSVAVAERQYACVLPTGESFQTRKEMDGMDKETIESYDDLATPANQ